MSSLQTNTCTVLTVNQLADRTAPEQKQLTKWINMDGNGQHDALGHKGMPSIAPWWEKGQPDLHALHPTGNPECLGQVWHAGVPMPVCHPHL